jgi:lipopolysaccharide biosynthesis protein
MVAPDGLTVLRKPNIGYDFGSWSIALDMIPQIVSAERVLLVNDSMVGPFTSLDPILAMFDTTRADVWALTDTKQFGHHLQSYFLGFRHGVLADRPLQAFWASIRQHADKMRIILDYEVGLGRLLRAEGYSTDAAFSNELVVRAGQNPVILGWKRLLELGFPFVKRELLHRPHVAPAGATVPLLVKEMFGVDVAEWTNDQPVGAT